jgi:hypothetical protein
MGGGYTLSHSDLSGGRDKPEMEYLDLLLAGQRGKTILEKRFAGEGKDL